MPTFKPALLVFFVWNCNAWAAAAFEVQWAPDLGLKDLSHTRERLETPFDTPVTLKKQAQTISSANCSSLLQARDSGYVASSDRDAPVVQLMAVDCRAIKALSRARPARISFLRTFELTLEALAVLPADLAPVLSREDREKAERAAAEGLSWKQLDPSAAVSIEHNTLVVTAAGMRTIVKIYGRGDFNQDGVDDVILRVDTAATEGSYSTSRLFLLTRAHRNTALRILSQLE